MVTLSKFEELLTATPTVKNLYFKGIKFGGKSPCMVINEKNGFVLPNCTGYVWGIWLQASGLDYKLLNLCGSHAVYYYSHKDNFERSADTPKVGAIACWDDKSYGHVGIVEHIYTDKSIDVKMSSYGGSICYTRHLEAPYDYTNDFGTKMKLQGFIYCPYIEVPKDLKPVDEVAKEVIAGKWGNGQTRYKRLTDAGYDYSEVQNRVNEILASQRALRVGDTVQIINKGNSQANGKGKNAYGYMWKRKILKIYSGYAYPYQVGNDKGTTGFYKASALKKL